MARVGSDLIEAMTEALSHARGEGQGTVHIVETHDVDPRAVRKGLGLTQVQMARVLGASLSGYRKWEQGVRAPGGAVRTLLRVMEREPEAVLRALELA